MVHQDDNNTPTNTTTATSPIPNGDDVDTASKQLQQLDQLHAVIQMEDELTSWIERVRPWIQSSDRTEQHTHGAGAGDVNSNDSNYDDSIYSNMCRVRPIPTTMGQVHDILCVARSYANRTSAPPGWIPTAPVLNFSTPNPLPHQLRHGALAALQLQRALQQQQAEAEAAAVRKRKIQQAAVEQEAAVADRIAAELAHNKLQNNNNDNSSTEPQHPASAKTQLQQHHHVPPVVVPQQPKRPRQDITMNLSDSSSSDDDEDDDE
jgi:Vitamin-D-receptor interacting Mediator subunit 4